MRWAEKSGRGRSMGEAPSGGAGKNWAGLSHQPGTAGWAPAGARGGIGRGGPTDGYRCAPPILRSARATLRALPVCPLPVPADTLRLRLACHPDAPDERVAGIAVAVERGPAGLLLSYRLEGELAALRIPDTPLDRERLWAHTCFEAFFAQQGSSAYQEFNFSPNGQWRRFDFSAYRQRIASPAGTEPAIQVRREGDCLELSARLPADQLPSGTLVAGLTAVVEHADGGLGYWALRHPPGKPDFHHRDGLALTLAAP